MKTFGWSWDRTTVAKIENGSRQVTLDEFVALAWVLGVCPASLFTPMDSATRVAVTPHTSEPASNVWRWACGTSPLSAGRRKSEVVSRPIRADEIRFYEEARPDYLAVAERELPGLTRLHQLVASLQSLAGSAHGRAREHEVEHFDEAVEMVSSLRRRAQSRVRNLV